MVTRGTGAPGAGGPRRWSCWTWPCPATSTRPRPRCPGSAVVGLERSLRDGRVAAAGPVRWPATRTWPRSGQIVAEEFAAHVSAGTRPRGRAHRGRAAGEGRRGGGRRAGPAGRPAGRPGRPDPGRDRPDACAGWWTSCCTHPPCGSRSWPARPGGDSYEAALRVLFDLDPATVGGQWRALMRAWLARPEEEECHVSRRRCCASAPARARWPWPSPAGRPADHRAHRPGRRAGRHDHVRRRHPGPSWPRSAAPACSSARCATSLLHGEVDLAVHSLKDLPTAPAPGHPARRGARRGTTRGTRWSPGTGPSSPTCRPARGSAPARRAGPPSSALLRPDLQPVPVRGNAGTRLGKVASGELDAVVLAYAGLARIGRLDAVTQVFEPDEMLPAPGQGALAVECRADDTELAALLARLDDPASRAATDAERAVLAALQAGLQRAGRRVRRTRGRPGWFARRGRGRAGPAAAVGRGGVRRRHGGACGPAPADRPPRPGGSAGRWPPSCCAAGPEGIRPASDGCRTRGRATGEPDAATEARGQPASRPARHAAAGGGLGRLRRRRARATRAC